MNRSFCKRLYYIMTILRPLSLVPNIVFSEIFLLVKMASISETKKTFNDDYIFYILIVCKLYYFELIKVTIIYMI